MSPQKFDIYQAVTDKIVAMLEKGVGTFELPWHTTGKSLELPRNLRGTCYRGANTLLLWFEAQDRGYTSPVWGTYKAWTEKGAQVRKGEQGTLITFWKSYISNQRKDAKDNGKRLTLRYYNVFNANQVDGWTPPAVSGIVHLDEAERIVVAESFFTAIGAKVTHGARQACYIPSRDVIHMPKFCDFRDPVAYYATLGHEHVHWTGHESRLDRQLRTSRFGDAAYAVEELIAEFGGAFLCANLGLTNEPREDHAQYIQSWLQVLKSDKKAIFTATSKAQLAVDFLCGEREVTDVA